jgi:hypothetical protein
VFFLFETNAKIDQSKSADPYLCAMEVLPTANFQPDIIVAGLRIGEPVIAFTGLVAMVVCFYAWRRLKKTDESDAALQLAGIFFLLMGFSTMIGSIVGHCFLYCLPFAFKAPGWVLGMLSVSAFAQSSIVQARPFINAGWGRALSWMNLGGLILGLWFVISSLWFPGVEIHSAFVFLCIITPLESWLLNQRNDPGSRYILLGILLLAAAAAIHVVRFSLGIWFSFFDIGHLFMAGTFWCFFLGVEAKQMKSGFEPSV